MGKKISTKTENEILQLHQEGLTQNKIAEKCGVSRRTVCNVLSQNRVPMYYKEQNTSETASIINILSLRLLYFCNEYELLVKMFVVGVCSKGCKKITIPRKMNSIIEREKIETIVKLSNMAGLECELQFA